MNKIIIGLVLIIVGGGVWWVNKNKSGEGLNLIENVQEGTTEMKAESPYTLEAMEKREYKTQVVIENEIRRTARFISYKVTYDSDGLKQYALMNVPVGTTPNSGWPVVIVNHGYIPPEVYSTENSYINTSAYFANAGFLVLKPDYRGHDNSEGETGGLITRISYAVDVLNLMAGIKNLEQADENKIFMYGHSMGGDVTLRILEVSKLVKAATLWAPAVNTFPEGYLYFVRRNPTPSGRMERYTQELEEHFPKEIYNQVDTLANVDRINVPVNIQHGTSDESVPLSWGEVLNQKLKEAGREVNFYSYPNDNHDISRNWSTALNRDIELFLDN